MTMRARRLLLCLVFAAGVASAACDGNNGAAPASPTPTPPPTPAPAPTPPPTPPPAPEPAALATLTLSHSTVEGQFRPQGVVTLTAPAPAGNAVIALASTVLDAARVPATVSVPAGTTTATFQIDTATVATQASTTISASYLGVSKTASLTVLPPALIPRLTVSSPSRGIDACQIDDAAGNIDCQLDGSASSGFIARYVWTLRFDGKEASNSTGNPVSSVTTTCAFFEPSSPGKGQLTVLVQLQLEDRNDVRTSPADRTIIVSTNGKCGF